MMLTPVSAAASVSPPLCPSSSPPSPPLFICLVLVEEGGQAAVQQHAASSSGAHSGSSPPPSISSGASSASQDSAICASSSTSPLPPPDPGQAAPSSAPSSSSSSIGPILHVAWLPLDPLCPSNFSKGAGGQIRLDSRNALEQLQKLANEAETRCAGRASWLVCSRRAIRQSLYPLCAQAMLAKLTEGGDEQVFSARLPLPPLFHHFLPFPLANSSPPAEGGDPTKMAAAGGNGGGAVMEELMEGRLAQIAAQLAESTLWQQAAKGGKMEPEKWMEPVQQGYTPALCRDGHAVGPRTVVRARGLPWQVSDLDVALFFAGLDISKGGIALCLGPEGRRNGECLVRFDCAEHRDWALERHRRHLRQRYIEVYRAGGDEFVRHAIGIDRCAVEFAQRAEQQQHCRRRQSAPAQTDKNAEEKEEEVEEEEEEEVVSAAMIVRMRGLPFTATEQQIRDFFASDGMPSGILDQGVLFVHRPDGRPSGDAFVLFGEEQSGRRALQKHRQRMGSRYIELFRTTQAEVQQLFNARQHAIAAMNGQNGGSPQQQPNGQQRAPMASAASLQQALPIVALGGGLAANAGQHPPPPHQQQQQLARQRDCLRLRGLPYEAQVQQVVEFMGPMHARHVLFQGVHMIYNAAGHPSGEAFIQMESEQAAAQAAQECHNKFMELGKKRRYIEVFQCCAEDMSLLLNVLPNSAQAPPPSAMPGLLATPMAANGGAGPPPLIPLPTPFTPNGAGGGHAAPSPLLAFPAGPFFAPSTLGSPTGDAAGILMPQFATPLAHLYASADSVVQFGHPTVPPDFWLRHGFGAALRAGLPVANSFAPTPLLPIHTPIAVHGNGVAGVQFVGGQTEATVVKMS